MGGRHAGAVAAMAARRNMGRENVDNVNEDGSPVAPANPIRAREPNPNPLMRETEDVPLPRSEDTNVPDRELPPERAGARERDEGERPDPRQRRAQGSPHEGRNAVADAIKRRRMEQLSALEPEPEVPDPQDRQVDDDGTRDVEIPAAVRQSAQRRRHPSEQPLPGEGRPPESEAQARVRQMLAGQGEREDGDLEAMASGQPRAAADPGQAGREDDEEYFDVNVFGQPKRMSKREIIAAAQQHMASGVQYQDVVRLRNEMEAEKAELRRTIEDLRSGRQPATSVQPPPREASREGPPAPQDQRRRPVITEEQAREFVSHIEEGDTDGAVKSFASLMNEMATTQRAASPDVNELRASLTRDIFAEIGREEQRREAAAALQQEYPEVFEDEELAHTSARVMGQIAMAELEANAAHGLVRNLTPQHIAMMRHDPRQAVEWHRLMRERSASVNPQFRPILSDAMELVSRSAQHVVDRYGSRVREERQRRAQPPANGNGAPNGASNASRAQRKAELQPTPRRASTVSVPTPPASRDRSSIIKDIRKSRGQLVA